MTIEVSVFLYGDSLTADFDNWLKLQFGEFHGVTLVMYYDSRGRRKVRLEFYAVVSSGEWIKLPNDTGIAIQSVDFNSRTMLIHYYGKIAQFVIDWESKIQDLTDQLNVITNS